MSESHARFQKILTLAVNPAAQEGEAQAAFGKLRELVRQNPHLTAPPSYPPMPPPVEVKDDDSTGQWRLTKISTFWFALLIDNLSGQAYNLGLRSRFACDFSETPTALDITFTGSAEACESMGRAVAFLVDYINSQPQKP